MQVLWDSQRGTEFSAGYLETDAREESSQRAARKKVSQKPKTKYARDK